MRQTVGAPNCRCAKLSQRQIVIAPNCRAPNCLAPNSLRPDYLTRMVQLTLSKNSKKKTPYFFI